MSTIEDRLPWYVIKTQPKQEVRAECNLKAWGVNTFHPRISERSTIRLRVSRHTLSSRSFRATSSRSLTLTAPIVACASREESTA